MGSQDYSPIADQGVAAPVPKLRDRLKGAVYEWPSLEAGFEIVWFDATGGALADTPTAGERRKSAGRRWVAVDVRAHDMDFELPLKDPTGRVGMEVHVGLLVQVRPESASKVASRGPTSVRATIMPRVQRGLTAARSRLTSSVADGLDDPAAYELLRAEATEALWGELEDQTRLLPEWLSAEVSSVVVAFDAATKAHADAIIATEQEGRQAAARTTSKMDGMDAVAGRLLPRLSDPQQRIFIKAMMDPSPANIDEAVALAARAESETAGQMLQLVHRLLEGDYIDKSDPVYASLVAVVDGSLQQLGNGATSNAALEPGSTRGVSPTRDDQSPRTIEAEIVSEPGDGDWTGAGEGEGS